MRQVFPYHFLVKIINNQEAAGFDWQSRRPGALAR